MMAYLIHPGRRLDRERMTGAAGAALVCAMIGYVLIAGLRVGFPRAVSDPLALFALSPPPPAPPPVPQRKKSVEPEGAASPANLRATPTELVAPPPPIPLPPPPLAAAPKAGLGTAPSAGAAPVPGPGTGAGGQGNGSGSGNSGDGSGGGGETPLRWIKGSIRDSDYPRAALKAGISGTVGLRFTVGVTGRVTSCTVTRSSGNRELDTTTCTLIMKRFRYIPTRNARGEAIPDEVTGEHVWETLPAPPGSEPDE